MGKSARRARKKANRAKRVRRSPISMSRLFEASFMDHVNADWSPDHNGCIHATTCDRCSTPQMNHVLGHRSLIHPLDFEYGYLVGCQVCGHETASYTKTLIANSGSQPLSTARTTR